MNNIPLAAKLSLMIILAVFSAARAGEESDVQSKSPEWYRPYALCRDTKIDDLDIKEDDLLTALGDVNRKLLKVSGSEVPPVLYLPMGGDDLKNAQSKIENVNLHIHIHDVSALEAYKQVAKLCDYEVTFTDTGLLVQPRTIKQEDIIVQEFDVSKYTPEHFMSLPREIVDVGPATQIAYDPKSKRLLYQDRMMYNIHTKTVLELLGLLPPDKQQSP